MNAPPVSVLEVKVGTGSAKCWKTERLLSENDQAGKTVVSRRSQFELEDVGRNGIKRGGGHITPGSLFDLNSPAVQLGT